MTEFLNYKIGDRATIRKVIITDIEKIKVPMGDDKESEKIRFKVKDHNNKNFEISDVWINNHKNETKIHGLWLTLNDGKISPTSSLAKLMTHYNVDTLDNFEGLEVLTYPDERDFLVLVACDKNKLGD